MSQETTKETSQYIDNKSFDADLQIAGVLPVGYDGSVLRKEQSKLVAKKITIDGNDTYVATAPIGSDYADAVWQCKKLLFQVQILLLLGQTVMPVLIMRRPI